MYGAQSNSGGSWVKQFLIAALFVGALCGIVAVGSLFIDKWNNDQLLRIKEENQRLKTNNLMLVKNNRELTERDKRNTKILNEVKAAMEGYKP